LAAEESLEEKEKGGGEKRRNKMQMEGIGPEQTHVSRWANGEEKVLNIGRGDAKRNQFRRPKRKVFGKKGRRKDILNCGGHKSLLQGTSSRYMRKAGVLSATELENLEERNLGKLFDVNLRAGKKKFRRV